MEPTQAVSLNVFDIIVLGIVGYGMFRGYKKGMLTSVVGIIGIVAGIVLGVNFSYVFKGFFAGIFDIAPQYITLLSFALVFVIVLIIITFIFRFLEDLLARLNLGINNALGALTGGYFAAIVLSVIIMILRPINVPSQTSVSDSLTYNYLRTFAVDNAKVAVKILPLAKDALKQLDNLVKDKVGQPKAPSPVNQEPKPTPIR